MFQLRSLVSIGAIAFLVLVLTFFTHIPKGTPATPLESFANNSGTASSSAASVASSTTNAVPANVASSSSPALKSAPTGVPPIHIEPVPASSTPPSLVAVPVIPPAQLSAVVSSLRKSLVNIVCVSNTNSVRTISGSGVVIDPRGIILTVAHVGQFSLLKDYPVPNSVICLIRTGSPAKTMYLAAPIYVSRLWLAANPRTLVTTLPSGTGEDDIALLGITQSATSDPLPTSFAYTPLSATDVAKGDSVVIGSYGAEFLTDAQIRTALYPINVPAVVKDVFTFDRSTLDLLSLGGGAAAQEGSSGGGVVNLQGQLVGLITTSTIGGDINARDLHAITVGHIRRSYAQDTNNSFDSYIQRHSVSVLVSSFAAEAQTLAQMLISTLQSSG